MTSLFAGMAACHDATPIPDGDLVATLIAPPLEGHPFDAATLRGKPSVVLFASPSCVHCMAELPRVQALAARTGAGVVAVFVAGNRTSDRAFTVRTKYTGPALVDDGSLRVKYAVDRVPYTVVVGGDGHARAAFVGEVDDGELRDAIAAAANE